MKTLSIIKETEQHNTVNSLQYRPFTFN